MKITITKKARDYLLEKRRKTIVISFANQSCWGGSSSKFVVVSTKENFDKAGYTEHILDDYKIYIHKKLTKTKEELIIDLGILFSSKQLIQKGLEI